MLRAGDEAGDGPVTADEFREVMLSHDVTLLEEVLPGATADVVNALAAYVWVNPSNADNEVEREREFPKHGVPDQQVAPLRIVPTLCE